MCPFEKGLKTMPQTEITSELSEHELCPVCNTVQLTYKIKGRPNDRYMVEHKDRNGQKCGGSHKTR